MLAATDGHERDWETVGDRKAFSFRHGSGAGSRRNFDPAAYCVVLFNQRATGTADRRRQGCKGIGINRSVLTGVSRGSSEIAIVPTVLFLASCRRLRSGVIAQSVRERSRYRSAIAELNATTLPSSLVGVSITAIHPDNWTIVHA
jgi:hypothetical protein